MLVVAETTGCCAVEEIVATAALLRVNGSSNGGLPHDRTRQQWCIRQTSVVAATEDCHNVGHNSDGNVNVSAATAITGFRAAVETAAAAALLSAAAAVEGRHTIEDRRQQQRHRHHMLAIAATKGRPCTGEAGTVASMCQQQRRVATSQEMAATVSPPCVGGITAMKGYYAIGNNSDSSGNVLAAATTAGCLSAAQTAATTASPCFCGSSVGGSSRNIQDTAARSSLPCVDGSSDGGSPCCRR